jgi:serine/threonine protein kinase/Tol biopolymer transport system component
MTLAPGTRLGPYDITAQIGEGGMGQVYRATDTKLKRQVAIKILPPSVAGDPDRLARFQREAEVLASLNHPHIAAIHGLEESGGVSALVMELVEGEDLSLRIARGAIPIDEALLLATQIAEALEAAHEQGIIHRDLKPGNIKVRADGTVKVLDFGLAKAVERSAAAGQAMATQSPTITTPAMTAAGMILGTAAYMAPEQARGRAVDRRADIWAFGCVLFEMLTGARAFPGEDVTDTLAAVVRADPDWSLVPSAVSPTLLVFLRRSLAKDPRQRLGDMRDLRLAIEGAFDTPAPAAVTSTTIPEPPRSAWSRIAPLAVSAVVAAAVVGTSAWLLKPAPPAPAAPQTRFAFTLPDGQSYTNYGRPVVAISPDGSQMAYIANRRLYLRPLAAIEARPIAGVESINRGINTPVFSPDGRSLVFFANADSGDGTLKTIAASGGAAVTICPATNPLGMSWDESGILFGQPQGIMRVAATGGQPSLVVAAKNGETISGPHVLPGGEWVMFTARSGLPAGATALSADEWDKAQIVVQSLKTSERKTLISGGAAGRFVATGSTAPESSDRERGHILYMVRGVLFAVPFNPRRLEVTGGPVPVVEGLRRALAGMAQFSVSTTGTLMFVPGPVSEASGAQVNLSWFDRKGAAEPIKIPAGSYSTPRISPDGTRIAVARDDESDSSVWTYELSGATAMRRLTFEGQGRNRFPVWSSDSQRVVFQSDRDGDQGLFWQRADNTSVAERLTKADEGSGHVPSAVSPDGQHLLYDVVKGRDSELWVLSLKDKKAARFADVKSSNGTLANAVFSPDGRWVAYASRDGRSSNAVYVQPFPPTGAKFQISRDSEDGHHPAWSSDGSEIIYVAGPLGNGVVHITTRPAFAFTEPEPWQRSFLTDTASVPRTFDLARDGRVLGLTTNASTVTSPDGRPDYQQFQVVLNWFEELRAKVPSSK